VRIASLSELEKAESDFKSLEARLARQEADVTVSTRSLEVLNQQLEDMTIRAPFSGIVTAKNAQPGEVISPMSAGGFTRTGICTLVDMESLEIEVDVNESFLNRVSPGQRVEATLDAYTDWKIPAKVIAIIPTADRQKATVRVRVGFDKLDPRILPQMGVKVAFRAAEQAAPTTPTRTLTLARAALQERDGKQSVWMIRNGKAERRAIKTEGNGADTVNVIAGLSAGDRVIVDPPATLAEGNSVKERK
jgi:HlyD family secretion protein